MRCFWDEQKAEKVKREHGVEFAKVITIFEDPFALEFIDEKHSTQEETRYAIIGTTSYGLTYLVFTESIVGELRFVTARKADKWMVKEYEENKH